MLTLEPVIVPATVSFIWTPEDYERFAAERPEAEPWPDNDYGSTQYFDAGGRALVVITINPAQHAQGEVLDLIDTLTHEAVHAWQAVREAMNETEPGPEAEAYFVAGLVRWMAGAVLPLTRS